MLWFWFYDTTESCSNIMFTVIFPPVRNEGTGKGSEQEITRYRFAWKDISMLLTGHETSKIN